MNRRQPCPLPLSVPRDRTLHAIAKADPFLAGALEPRPVTTWHPRRGVIRVVLEFNVAEYRRAAGDA